MAAASGADRPALLQLATVNPREVQVRLDPDGESRCRRSVFLPLSPTRLAALGKADRFEAVTAAAVRQVNRFQVAKAHDYVYMHPGSGLQKFVASERPPTGP